MFIRFDAIHERDGHADRHRMAANAAQQKLKKKPLPVVARKVQRQIHNDLLRVAVFIAHLHPSSWTVTVWWTRRSAAGTTTTTEYDYTKDNERLLLDDHSKSQYKNTQVETEANLYLGFYTIYRRQTRIGISQPVLPRNSNEDKITIFTRSNRAKQISVNSKRESSHTDVSIIQLHFSQSKSVPKS